MINICPLESGVTGMLLHVSSLVTFMRQQKGEIKILLLLEVFMGVCCSQ